MPAPMPLPKYHQIYLVLREQLADGRFERGLPGELRLTREFGVSRATVRQALGRLASDGLIVRARGRGTVPTAAPPAPARAGGPLGLLDEIVGMGLRTRVMVLSCEVLPASSDVAQRLGVAPGTPVQKAVRLRSCAAGPLSHITTCVPQSLARGFGRRELARRPMLLLLEAAGVAIGRARQLVSARLADADVARHLDVPVGSALLAVNRLVHDADDRPVQWLQGLYRPDRYQYEMQLSGAGGLEAKVWVGTERAAQSH